MKSGNKFPFLRKNTIQPSEQHLNGSHQNIDSQRGTDFPGNANQPTIVEPQSPGGPVRGESDRSKSVDDKKPIQKRFSLGYNLTIIIGGVAIAEVIAMGVVYFYRFLPYYQQVLLDATVMAVIIFPLIYFLSSRPLLQHIQKRIQTESILRTRLRLIQFAGTHTLDELLQATLDEIEILTNSTIGYFHFLEADQKTLRLRAWSTNTLQNICTLTSNDSHYDVEQAGVWTDCIRARRPVIHNDYASLPHRKGLPDGHAPITREMAVPIIRDEKIMAILGMGNKPQDYSTDDVELVSTLADFAWERILSKQAGEALRESEEKFRTLVNWTYDWEIWLGPRGNIVYTSPSCKRITGYGPEEFMADPSLILRGIHPDDRPVYESHQQFIHDESATVEQLEYRVITHDGKELWIEHICRPLFGEDNRYLGRRISNRDITERKQAEQQIRERNQKEQMLTQTIHTLQLDMARDLHDTLGQNISFLRMKLDYLDSRKIRKQSELQMEIQNMARAANESYDLLRGTLAMLQSADSTDLYRLLTRYTGQIEERSTFKVDFSSQGEPRPIAAPRLRQLFYIFREILNNIEKHARASQVTIEMLWNADHLKLIVSDNGQGFDVNQTQFGGHYGLKFMRERVELLNGSLTLRSEPGSGTNVAVLIPYETS
jgi:PAS domain S-box-containing protein